ncbi:LamG domain-containing protein, partial [Candidatus Falkowbacteria bacterium]|nr:LamG domain-containing protein [Candidatus Falkowbacteria bacterium]
MNIFKKIALNLRIMKPEGFKIKLRYFLNSLNKLFRFKSWKSRVLIGVFVILVLGAGTFLVYSQSGGGGSIGGSSLNKGLIAHWGLDLEDYDTTTGQITDKTPYSNHGTNYGSMSTTDRYEKIGGAMSFNGTSDYVLINDVVTTNPTSFTIAAWIKKDGNGAVYECVLHQGSDTSIGNSSFWLGLDASDYFTATIGARTGVGWSAGILTEKPVIGEWNHLLASWDGSVVRVYLNGVFKKQYNLASYSNISTPVRLGASSNGSTYQFNGSIDDVRIYNRAFSDEEVMLLYGSYEPKIQISSINAGLVGHWTLSEEDYNSSTSQLSDKTPYSNHGSNSGATFTTDRHGKTAGAMSFSSGNTISVLNNSSLNNNSLSISFWAYHRDYTYPKTFGAIKKSTPNCYAAGGKGWDFGHGYKSDGVDVCVADGNNIVRSTLYFNTGSRPPDLLNKWTHIVYIIDRSQNKVSAYVNGVKQSSEISIAS